MAEGKMGKGRLEAFSDGVIAILITIMVLELKVPHGDTWEVLKPLVPVFFSYVVSFLYIGIYWNNHHHMMNTVDRITGSIMWGNLNLLFWMSLIPFTTAWMGENNFAVDPTVLYGVDLLLCAIAYFILQNIIIKSQGPHSVLKKATQKDYKGKLSTILYIVGIIVAFYYPKIAFLIYAAVALMWFIPDRRVEKTLHHHTE